MNPPNSTNSLFAILLMHGRKSLFLLLTMLFLAVAAQAQSGRGAISGQVTTADGQPAPYVTVALKSTNRGSTTNEAGQFTLKNVPAGTQTLLISLVGYQPREQTVEVRPSETATANVLLNETAQELREVIVTGGRKLKPAATQLNRMPIEYLEDVQSYSVTTKETIREIGATDMQTALRVIPGLASANTDGYGYVTSYARGFNVRPIYRNGLAVSGLTGGDIQNVERLELLRGPAGTLFGNPGSSWEQSYGGILNKVTKSAFNGTLVEANFINGSYGLLRAGADVNVVLSKEHRVCFRMNGAYQSEHSWQMIDMKRKDLQFAPVVVFEPTEKLSFKLEAEMNSNDYPSMFYFGTTGLNLTKPRRMDELGLNYSRNYSDRGFTHAKPVTQDFFAGQAKYKVSPQWNLTVDLQKTLYNHANGAVFNEFYQDTLMIRDWYDYDYRWNNTSYQANVNGRFNIGKIKNNLLIGTNFTDRYDDGGGKYSYDQTERLDTVNLKHDVVPVVDVAHVRSRAGSGESFNWRSAVQTFGVYVADQIDAGERLHVFLSMRYDHFFNRTNKVNQTKPNNDWNQGAVSPRLGVVYEALKDKISLFGNYASSFKYNGPTPTGQTLKPEYGNQLEAGVKLGISSNLTSTISYYDITVVNMVRPNPTNPTLVVQDGTRTSQGIDVELVATLVTGWNITAGYGYNNSKIVKAEDPNIEGKRAAGSAPHSATLWTTYTLPSTSLKGLGLGLGGSHYGENYFNDQNSLIIPASTVVNASVFYNADKWRFGLNLNNLTNQKYWSVAANPQKPFNVLASLSIKI